MVDKSLFNESASPAKPITGLSGGLITDPPAKTSGLVANPPAKASGLIANPLTGHIADPPAEASQPVTDPLTNPPAKASSLIADPPAEASGPVADPLTGHITNPPAEASQPVTDPPTNPPAKASSLIADPPAEASGLVANPLTGHITDPPAEASQPVTDPLTGLVQTGSETRPDPLAPGLYLVATPIGNLEDITLRALRILRSADRIACEDTRQSGKLLAHYGISKPLVSLHAHNEGERAEDLLPLLAAGGRLAVISDAGTPGISDPGMLLTRLAVAAGIPVFPVPGANAALSALVASGLPTEQFTFHGFLPEKAGARRTALEALADSASSAAPSAPATQIFYEAPHRILDTLADLDSIFGARAHVVVARELTKLHEEFLRGSPAEIRATLAARDRVRGEIVLLLKLSTTPGSTQPHQTLSARVAELCATDNLDEKTALKRAARERNLGKSDAYRELQRERAKR